MRIIVAIEGGEIAERTAAAVGPWARMSGAEVFLLSVLHPHAIHETVSVHLPSAPAPQGTAAGQLLDVHEVTPTLAEDRSQALARVHGEREDYLRALALRHLGGASYQTRIVASEHTAGAIVQACGELQANLIVMGTHGRKGLSHTLFGSVAESVVRRAPVPVLLVGPEAKP